MLLSYRGHNYYSADDACVATQPNRVGRYRGRDMILFSSWTQNRRMPDGLKYRGASVH